MSVKAEDSPELLERVALQEAAERAAFQPDHGSKIARLPASGWQARVLRASAGVAIARNPEELRLAMQRQEGAVILLPVAAMLTEAAVRQICIDSSFNKLLIWETA